MEIRKLQAHSLKSSLRYCHVYSHNLITITTIKGITKLRKENFGKSVSKTHRTQILIVRIETVTSQFA